MSKSEYESIVEFADWYSDGGYKVDQRGRLIPRGFSECASRKYNQYMYYKSEQEARTATYWKYEKQAAAEVVSEKADLPNISSGENAGFIRRMARNVVQHTPNVFISNQFDDDSIPGVIARHMLKTKIIGDDQYSNDMQQNLITTFRRGATIGFDCVLPVLLKDRAGSWYMKYDAIYYRDVFPEPGAKDIRQATDVFIRRYLTRGEVNSLIKNQVAGWDIAALSTLYSTQPKSRQRVDHESRKHSVNPQAYEVITWYSDSGDAFLTFDADMKLLLRIELNKHPLKEHPVKFFLPEKDDQQAYGKSLLSLTYGRQEFQDLYFNGAMKMFYRNINPPIIGYGNPNAMPNLSPGKYTPVSNPNAKFEAFEINTQSLMMFGQISNQNQAAMVQLLGAADQQMAAQSTGGMMSQTPQGVDAQQAMVDITTNNYQKAMENFFSQYCSYALTIYFQELKSIKVLTPTADVRKDLIDQGISPDAFVHEAHVAEFHIPDPATGRPTGQTTTKNIPADGTGLKDGQLQIDFKDMAVLYYVQCVPGSLVELEDEKQLRILKEIFVPLSQAMPAIAQAGDPRALKNASNAMQYIIEKTISLSGSSHASELARILNGQGNNTDEHEERILALENAIGGSTSNYEQDAEINTSVLEGIMGWMSSMHATMQAMAQQMGIQSPVGPPAPGGQPVAPTAETQAVPQSNAEPATV